jgi:hypothetical protein
MRRRLQAVWLTILMGSVVSDGPAAWAADVQSPPPLQTAGAVVQPPIVTSGPVYAYGPVIRQSKPRQRVQKPNWSGRNLGRYNNMRAAARYGTYQAQAGSRPWQYARPQYDGNTPARANAAPYSAPYGGYRRPWATPQSPNALAWYDRGGPQNDAPYRVRQPNWRY